MTSTAELQTYSVRVYRSRHERGQGPKERLAVVGGTAAGLKVSCSYDRRHLWAPGTTFQVRGRIVSPSNGNAYVRAVELVGAP